MRTGKRLAIALMVASSCSQANVYFASDLPPDVGPAAAPLCYEFRTKTVEEQMVRLAEKYGASLGKVSITRADDGSKILQAHRTDENGRDVIYLYFESPLLCNAFQWAKLKKEEPQQEEDPLKANDMDVIVSDDDGNRLAVYRQSIRRYRNGLAKGIGAVLSGRNEQMGYPFEIVALCDDNRVGLIMGKSGRSIDLSHNPQANLLINYMCGM